MISHIFNVQLSTVDIHCIDQNLHMKYYKQILIISSLINITHITINITNQLIYIKYIYIYVLLNKYIQHCSNCVINLYLIFINYIILFKSFMNSRINN